MLYDSYNTEFLHIINNIKKYIKKIYKNTILVVTYSNQKLFNKLKAIISRFKPGVCLHFKIKSKTGVMEMVEGESVLLLMSHTNLKN